MARSTDMGIVQEVDGIKWSLLLTEKGVTWKAQADISGEQEADLKQQASINVADFSTPLPTPDTKAELSFSDMVPKK